MTFRNCISDLELFISQALANRKFPRSQLAFWILCSMDYLKKQHLLKIDSGAFVHQYTQLPVLTDAVTGRKYIELPTGIYDIDSDGGVVYLSYDYTLDSCSPTFTSVSFTRTTTAKSERLYWDENEYPAPDNPYFYRIGDRLYLLGTECISVSFLEGGFLSSFDPNTQCSMDDEMDFPQELYPILQRQVLQLAMYGLPIPKNTTNSGIYNLDEDQEYITKQKIATAAAQEETATE